MLQLSSDVYLKPRDTFTNASHQNELLPNSIVSLSQQPLKGVTFTARLLFRPFRAADSDSHPTQGVALGWFYLGPFGAGELSYHKLGKNHSRCGRTL